MKTLISKADKRLSIYGLPCTTERGIRRITSWIYRCHSCKAWFHPIDLKSIYCSRKCSRGIHMKFVAFRSEVWNKNSKGYIEGLVVVGQGKRIRMKQHRWLMQNHLGKKITQRHHVHHINGIKDDNRLTNLQLLTALQHNRLSMREHPIVMTPEIRKQKSEWMFILNERRRKAKEARQIIDEYRR